MLLIRPLILKKSNTLAYYGPKIFYSIRPFSFPDDFLSDVLEGGLHELPDAVHLACGDDEVVSPVHLKIRKS
jgi:hypothetical protein